MNRRALALALALACFGLNHSWARADGMPTAEPDIASMVAPALTRSAPNPSLPSPPGVAPAFAGAPASPLGVKDINEGDNLFFRISSTEPTRLSIAGGRIAALNYIQEDLDVSQDNALGQAYLRPRALDKVITLYVTTSTDTTATLTLQPTAGPATSIRLRDVKVAASKQVPSQKQAVPTVASDYSKAIESLITVAAKDLDVSGVDVVQLHQPVVLWEGVDFVLRRKHNAHNMAVETYTLRNASTQVLRVIEQEFYTPSVAGVAIEHHELAPNASTLVFVARWVKE